jgi:hypothetical protein
MIQQRVLSLVTGVQATLGAILLASAFLLPCVAAAQNPPIPAQTDPDDEQTAPAPAKAAPAPAQTAPVVAQTGPTVTIRILDAKTGDPINPSNLLVHVDHKDEPFNEGLKLNGSDPATAVLPPTATLLAIEGAYDSSTQVFINCDTDSGKDSGTLKWYSIAEIMKTGVVTQNVCYKGKYQHRLNISPVPGEFVFFVRTHNWHEKITD